MKLIITLTTFIALLVTMQPVSAQEDAAEGPPDPEAAPETEEPASDDEAFLADEEGEPATEDDAFLAGEEVEQEDEIAAPEEQKDVSLKEDPEKPYFALGVRLRWLMIPEWFVKMFGVATTRAPADETNLPLISNIGVGPEFIYRKDGFDVTVAVWYAGLSWKNPISFKAKGDDNNSWEVVENSLKAILITADFMWSTSFTDWFAITYGAGLGLGIPWGEIIRTEATQASDGTEKCQAGEWYHPDNNPGGDAWCQDGEEDNERYDKLKVIPWINFLLGTRFKPHRNVHIYVDGGFGIGFQVGTRIGYIF